ncbi:MAG: alpha/beta hydrolase family protein [Planctomycetaceae bacterium]
MKTCIALMSLYLLSGAVRAEDTEIEAKRVAILALGDLDDAPAIHDAVEFESTANMRAIYFDALPWKSKPTRVFAWLGMPKTIQAGKKVPGMVLVHGGGGTAFKEWVQKWNDEGFAAISIAVEGQTDIQGPGGDGQFWKRHEHGGPPRVGIFGDLNEPIVDQWMYHAVADTALANSLLRSLPEVDKDRVGLMGISWGGIITSTVIGIDTRFAFAIPTYGCGDLHLAENQYETSLNPPKNPGYVDYWNPSLRASRAKMPVLWLTWLRDSHFPLTVQSSSYRAAAGSRMVAVLPDMGHSHPAGWNPRESYEFAKSIVGFGTAWATPIETKVDKTDARAQFTCKRPVKGAVLFHTTDGGYTADRKWEQSPAKMQTEGDRILVTASVPARTTACFFNFESDGLTVSSDFVELAR